MNGAALSLERFVESPPYLYGAKKRGQSAGMFRASTIEMARKLHPRRCLLVGCRLQTIQHPSHDPPAHVAQQETEVALKGHHLLGCRLIVDKLINEADTTGERA
jgi:hypothetical protein